MDHIKFHRLVKAIECQAAGRGYRGDIFAERDDVPLVGTLSEQMAIATIGCDTSPGPMSARDRELHGRLVRAVVLTSPPRQRVASRIDNAAKLAREWRRKRWAS